MTKNFRHLLDQLEADFPAINFVTDEANHWNFKQQTIFYNPTQPQAELLLLHEVGHMLLGHQDYQFDAELIKYEVDAWEQVRTILASKYGYAIDGSLIEEILEDYRQWLHQRATCPRCNQTGYQEATGAYRCALCQTKWRPNEAKFTNLRRQRLD